MAKTRTNGNSTDDKDKSEAQKIQEKALAALALLGGRATTDDDIKFEGDKYILPSNVKDLGEAIAFLEKRRRDEDQPYTFNRVFHFRPEDGAVATGNVIKRLFGTSIGKGTWSFFEGYRPPQLKDVKISTTEHVQAPFGHLELPGLPGLEIIIGSAHAQDYGLVFQLSGEGPRKYRFHVDGFFDAVQNELENNSIYRGKAINGRKQPEFLDLSQVKAEEVVYHPDVFAQLTGNVWTPIEQAEELRKRGHHSKRAVLFEGPYGTGKTLAAYLTGQRAIASGWTFILVRPGKDSLEQAIQTARMYQPAVVFTEDIDTSAATGSGDGDHMSRMLDLFDGIESKNAQLMLVLTTNNVGTLHPAMLRPGRLDAVISIRDLDVDGVAKLTQVILGDQLATDIDWAAFHESVEGYTPAFLREILGRTDIFVLSRKDRDVYRITTQDLIYAADSLRPQWQLMQDAKADPEEDSLLKGFRELMDERMKATLNSANLVDSDGEPTLGRDAIALKVPEKAI